MDSIIQFALDNPIAILGGVVVILIIVAVVKTIVKWVLTIAVLALLIYFGIQYEEDIKSIGEQVVDVYQGQAQEIIKRLTNEGDAVTYKSTGNGTFIITGGGVQLSGTHGAEKLNLAYGGLKLQIDNTDKLNEYIEQVSHQQ